MHLQFLIIGAQKCGTSSLFYYLLQHPELALPEKKEIHFFDAKHQNGIGWYEDHFSHKKKADKQTGEATPYYLFHPLVPQRIAIHYPQIKLIVLLRSPIDRAYSHFWMIKTVIRKAWQHLKKPLRQKHGALNLK